MDLVYTGLAFVADAVLSFVRHADEQITFGNLLLVAVVYYLMWIAARLDRIAGEG